MIKKLPYLLLAVIFISACKNKQKSHANDPASAATKKITKRDRTINAANSYNDIFFDSMKLVKFISNYNIDDNISRKMTSFYNARNYQYAWFASKGLDEQARGFWNLHKYHTTYTNDSSLRDKALEKNMDNLVAAEDLQVTTTDTTVLNTELKLTQHLLLFAQNNIGDGYLKRKELERFIPYKREDAMHITDSLLSKKHKDEKYYENINEPYGKLKLQLKQYYNIAKLGGWPLINITAKQFKAAKAPADIFLLKKRLSTSGDMNADTTSIFNEALTQGIKKFQFRHGYTPDGNLTDALIADMNIPVEERIQQILVNMGRMQWTVNKPAGEYIVVNIPEFILHVTDNNTKVFDMNVVVGKEGHNTTIFCGNLNQIIFSPYWNVPSSIVKKEILPAIAKNKHYLEEHNMEITGGSSALPDIRQLPGGDNSLGKVKFLFPNSFDIYFHDTPAKSLFNKDKRAYSHGCIRLSDPAKMAIYLLKDMPGWDQQRVETEMNSNVENKVRLKNAVPVLITYYTAWVDENGLLHFADDIYSHDKDIVAKMFL